MDAIAGILLGLWIAASWEDWKHNGWPELRDRWAERFLILAAIVLSPDFLVGAGIAVTVVAGLALSSRF